MCATSQLLAKQIMTKEMKQTHGLDAPNTYSVLTCCSAALLLVPSFAAEGPAALAAVGASEDGGSLMTRKLLLCGFFYFAYNQKLAKNKQIADKNQRGIYGT